MWRSQEEALGKRFAFLSNGVMFFRFFVLLAAILFAVPSPAETVKEDESGPLLPGVALNERVLNLPGDSSLFHSVTLQVTVLTPPGPGPFPLVVANHGATDVSQNNRGERYRRTFFSLYFLSRGYAVVLPMMQGFAGSGGKLIGHGCDVARTARDNAADIEAVIREVAKEPDIDASHILVVGQSFGGWNTLALGADSPSNVVGLINFNGGLRTSACRNDDDDLIDGAGQFGKRTHIPSLWFYGDNDQLFPPALWHAMYDHYVKAGGPAELDAFGKFGSNSHEFTKFPEALPLWTPRVDAFLNKIGLPSKVVHPDYMPKPWPQPSGYAAIDDLSKLPLQTDAVKDLYRRYLAKPIPKAFFFSPAGAARDQDGGFDPVGAGLGECRKIHQPCQVYAIDDQVVWKALPSVPPPSHYAEIGDVAKVPYVTDPGRDLYRRYLAKTGPKALVLGVPSGAYAYYGGLDPFGQAMVNCRDQAPVCEPYAVGDQVVWVPPN